MTKTTDAVADIDLETLTVELRERALIVTVNRPDKLNALSHRVLSDLTAVIGVVASLPRTEVAGLILTGSGDKAFIAGADIAEMSAMTADEASEFAKLGQSVPDLLESLDRPSIAAVNGFALGGGCEMAMGCDFIYATENAVFGQPEVKLGLIPAFGGCTRLSSRIGLGKAREVIVTGRNVTAEQALSWGLANAVFGDRESLIDAAVATIGEIAQRSPGAVAAARRSIAQAHETGHGAGLQAEVAEFGALFSTQDMREGTSAFLQKRRPEFEDH